MRLRSRRWPGPWFPESLARPEDPLPRWLPRAPDELVLGLLARGLCPSPHESRLRCFPYPHNMAEGFSQSEGSKRKAEAGISFCSNFFFNCEKNTCDINFTNWSHFEVYVLSDVKNIHMVVQPSPPPVSSMFSSCRTAALFPVNSNSPFLRPQSLLKLRSLGLTWR